MFTSNSKPMNTPTTTLIRDYVTMKFRRFRPFTYEKEDTPQTELIVTIGETSIIG